MVLEHEKINERVEELRSAWEGYRAKRREGRQLAELLRGLVAILKQHKNNEDVQMLRAEGRLSEEEQRRALERYLALDS